MTDPFALYLAKRFAGGKGYRPGVPAEAAALAEHADAALSQADYGLSMVCIVDRETDPAKRFSLSRQQLLDIGKDCLKYTGTLNGAKMPVGIHVYEVGDGPLADDDRLRLQGIAKSIPGLAKVVVRCSYVDVRSKTVWTTVPIQRLLRRLGVRGWVESLLHEGRKADDEIFQPDAALPSRRAPPVATISILAVLAVMFVVEQVARVGDKGQGLLGVDVGTLLALGGMYADAVTKHGEWYRLLSAALLHGDAFHILLNGVALGLGGMLLEWLVGPAWLLALFFTGALGGSLMGLAANPPNLVSVGASGAVMALLGAALVVVTRLPRGSERSQAQVQILQFLVPSLIPLATYRQEGHVDYAAHFGGAITGVLAGFLILASWPKTQERPRFAGAVRALAAAGVACFALSLVLVKGHFAAYAAEASFAAADVLVDDAKIPSDTEVAVRDVDVWGKDHPRDPRVHFFRALRMLEHEEDAPGAEAELRAALADRQVLDAAFADGKLEAGVRTVLSKLLLEEGRGDEARREAGPACAVPDGDTTKELRGLGLCP
jgi:rhomboid protease GluP